MKKLITLLMALTLVVAMTACGSSKPAPQPTAEPTSTPEPAPVSNPQVVEDVEIALEASLDYINENEDIDGATQFRNALLKGIEFNVIFADETGCEIEFTYPDGESYLNKAADMLTEEATAAEMDAALATVAKELEADTVRVIETISAEVEKNSDGSYTLVWNEDLYNAVSGGLYYAEER